jgi:hypothetical protein
VRTLFVVINSPFFDDLPGLDDVGEPMLVPAFVPEFAVQTLYISNLLESARLNEVEQNPVLIRPLIELVAGKLRPVIHNQPLRLPAKIYQTVEHLDNPCSAKKCVHLDPKTFPCTVINHGEIPDFPARDGSVMNEVHAPAVILLNRFGRFSIPPMSCFALSAFWNLQLLLSVNALVPLGDETRSTSCF